VAESDDQANDQAFALLNQYLEGLQRGDRPDRQSLLEKHPEFEEVLACLEALEALAPATSIDADGDPGENDLSKTIDNSSRASPIADGLTQGAARLLGDFGDYELLHEIGRGGMGVVYKARQKSLDRFVAVKVIASLLASGEQVRRFQVEAKAAAAINHPHVVQIHEVGEIYGHHYLAMEYVAGTTLASRLKSKKRLGIDETVSLLCAVAHAVHHLHQHGVVHRDLKPSNILLDEEGKPKVTDFGLAKVSTPDSQESANSVIEGTAAYMSPEQASGRGDLIGPRSDIYSLGAILYELLTGRTPFVGENNFKVLLQVRDSEPALPRQLNRRIPGELELICLKCLERSPEKRYSSAAALAEDLERYLKRETVEASPPNLRQRIWRRARREPALATRVVALSIFLAAVSYFYFLQRVVDPQYYVGVVGIVGLWLFASIGFQYMLTLHRWATFARFAWGLFDVGLLLSVLLLGDGVASPMTIGFLLLIVASGLWSDLLLIEFVTFSCFFAYGVLVAIYYLTGFEPKRQFDDQLDRHVYFLISLILCGFLVAFQVRRNRVLSRYFERRRMR